MLFVRNSAWCCVLLYYQMKGNGKGKMRKTIALILAAVIILSIAPCISSAKVGGIVLGPDTGTDQKGSSSTPKPTPTSTPKPTPTSTPKPTPSYKEWFDESVPVTRNSDIEIIIGKYLYSNAKGDVDPAIYEANKSGIDAYSVKYEDAYPRSIEVRFDENTNRFAGVIEIRWNWKYQGERIWHSWYYTYTGFFFDEDVTIDTRVQIEENKKATKNVEAFWKDNWPE